MRYLYFGRPGWFLLHAVTIAFTFWLGHVVRFKH
jgi:hypothetical protein